MLGFMDGARFAVGRAFGEALVVVCVMVVIGIGVGLIKISQGRRK